MYKLQLAFCFFVASQCFQIVSNVYFLSPFFDVWSPVGRKKDLFYTFIVKYDSGSKRREKKIVNL